MSTSIRPIARVSDYGNVIAAGFSIGEGANRVRAAIILHDANKAAEGIPQMMSLADAESLITDPLRLQQFAEKLAEIRGLRNHP